MSHAAHNQTHLAMNALPYMPLYPNDFLSDNKVRVMSNEELGAYFRLSCAAWQEDIPGTLPSDDDVLARLAGAELSLWRKLSRRILPCFTLNEETGRYEQKRMMAEHAKVAAQIEMKHSRAALGAGKRWEGHVKKSPTNAKAMLKQGDSNASQSQSQNPEKEKEPPPRWQDAPSIEQAVGAGARFGLPKDEAERFWHHFEAVGWINQHNQPIRNWQSKMASWKADADARKNKPGGYNGERQPPPPRKLPSAREFNV